MLQNVTVLYCSAARWDSPSWPSRCRRLVFVTTHTSTHHSQRMELARGERTLGASTHQAREQHTAHKHQAREQHTIQKHQAREEPAVQKHFTRSLGPSLACDPSVTTPPHLNRCTLACLHYDTCTRTSIVPRSGAAARPPLERWPLRRCHPQHCAAAPLPSTALRRCAAGTRALRRCVAAIRNTAPLRRCHPQHCAAAPWHGCDSPPQLAASAAAAVAAVAVHATVASDTGTTESSWNTGGASTASTGFCQVFTPVLLFV